MCGPKPDKKMYNALKAVRVLKGTWLQNWSNVMFLFLLLAMLSNTFPMINQSLSVICRVIGKCTS